ncbi:MAG TPA: DUF1592 domain-containing protein [Tepidisphaeraceae bacterium]|nr:DUF1592 domain-containing protein [Tepidisphaeraceae bacterium]
MRFASRTFVLLAVGLVAARAVADAPKAYAGAACSGWADAYFVNEVWAKVGAMTCLECHKAGGDAEDSEFVLRDPNLFRGDARDEAVRYNHGQFVKVSLAKENGKSLALLKATGAIKHGGKQALKPDSAGQRVLAEFVRRLENPNHAAATASTAAEKNLPPFFDGVVMMDDARLLRRVTLSLGGRLPTDAEAAAVAKDGGKALRGILDKLMTEDAFFDRLREAFNDVFLTTGVEGGEANILSYDHFGKSRLWYQKHDLTAAGDAKAQQQARYKLSADYRAALHGEPMKLVEHIVRNERPFTEIITADYVMMSPYTARGYGVFDEVKGRFKNPDDPFEYIPVRLKALVGRDKNQNQDSATGFYPHAGILSTFQYLARYPTTETNRNRLRSRMYYQHFLGVDVLDLAARVQDAAAVQAKFANPTMQASECVVCHKTLDPVSSLFQDYWRFAELGVYGKRKGGWFTDMFQAGFEGTDMPADQRWRALQWLGEQTVKDPRFAVAMVEHGYYVLTGRRVLLPPKDIDDPLYAARRRAYAEQRKQTEAIAHRFAENKFNFKGVLKDWIASDFYRADGLATAKLNPARQAELDDVGVVRMLAPEQVERKIKAVFGQPWGRLSGQTAMLYGGIDSQEVTERASDPSGAMGAIQRIMANDVALKNTAMDFSRQPGDRLLFPDVETGDVPGASPDADARIRKTIVRLHARVLGRNDAAESAEVKRTYDLFAAVIKDAEASKKPVGKEEIYSGRQKLLRPVPDPKYAVRAWRAVVTYMLRRPEFLYE